MKADEKTAYCIQLSAAFQSRNKIRKNATERLSEAQINDVALNLEYVKKRQSPISDGTTHYITQLVDSYKVSGDSFYMQNGSICLPLGTITVEKKAAPKGYLLDGAYLQVNGASERVTEE